MSQALEFDVNQSLGGHKFVFGTQCDYRLPHLRRLVGRHPLGQDRHPVLGAPRPTSGTTSPSSSSALSTNKVKFVSVTINGATHYINETYSPESSGAKELNIAFQMDGKKPMTPYYQRGSKKSR